MEKHKVNFFVIGLPRSRTAWLANFLTYDGSFCHHEGLDKCHSIREYKEKIGNDGDSGTGLMLIDLNREFPDAKKLIIESDVERAIDFTYKKYGVYDPDSFHNMKHLLDKTEGKRINFDDINDNLEEIWDYLVMKPYDKRRGDMLNSMNIQVNDPFDYDAVAATNLLREAGRRSPLDKHLNA